MTVLSATAALPRPSLRGRPSRRPGAPPGEIARWAALERRQARAALTRTNRMRRIDEAIAGEMEEMSDDEAMERMGGGSA